MKRHKNHLQRRTRHLRNEGLGQAPVRASDLLNHEARRLDWIEHPSKLSARMSLAYRLAAAWLDSRADRACVTRYLETTDTPTPPAHPHH